MKECSDVELLFELLEMAKYHLLDKLADAIQYRIITLKAGVHYGGPMGPLNTGGGVECWNAL